MNSMKRSSALVAIMFISGLTTACSDKTTGLPLPASAPPSTSPGSGGPFSEAPEPATTSSTNAVPTSPLKDVEPCSLLTQAEITDLHAGTPKSEHIGNARSCRFTEGNDFIISIAIFDEAGLDDVVAHGSITPVPTVGRHKSVRSIGGVDTCAISIEVTKTSRVDTQGTDDNGNEQRACGLAMDLAKVIEPKLP
jgi:hypothetical protein